MDSYLGAKLPGRFCLNFAYHFKVANNWPTWPDPLFDLAKLHTVSLQAQEYNPVVINLHIEHHPEMALQTRDQLLTEAHHLSTAPFSVTRTLPVALNTPQAVVPPVTSPDAASIAAPAQQIFTSA
jgi:hypothetical protein